MAEKLMTDGSMALREKQYRVITIEATEKPQNAKLRVAAYARVSSASDDQLNSFAAQNRHYSDLISSKENWRMVDIYADEGKEAALWKREPLPLWKKSRKLRGRSSWTKGFRAPPCGRS